MRVFHNPLEFQQACLEARREGSLGFVPTMGFLHEGHESLMRQASSHRHSALSIFVNPSQFGANEDLSRYPRDAEGDLAKAKACGIDFVLMPTPETMYPAGFQTWVEPGPLASELEGAMRPGHFRGVATIVLKLLQLAQPTHAYFGRKDFQQLAVVQALVRDFALPVEIVGSPTVREADGLAKSSRNAYLSSEERVRALALSRALRKAQEAFSTGVTRAAELEALMLSTLLERVDSVDYAVLRDERSLAPLDEARVGAVLLIAARVGRTRLIDNAELV